VLREFNPHHNLPFYFFKIQFNIILHLHLGLPNEHSNSSFSTKLSQDFLLASLLHATPPPPLICIRLRSLFLCVERPPSRRYGRTAALRLIVQLCDEEEEKDDNFFF
jgi:hypothetical protein